MAYRNSNWVRLRAGGEIQGLCGELDGEKQVYKKGQPEPCG